MALPASDERQWFTRPEVVDLLRIGLTKYRELVRAGEIIETTRGYRTKRISRAEVERLLTDNRN